MNALKILLIALVYVSVPAMGGVLAQGGGQNGKPRLEAFKTTNPITLDGRLDEDDWRASASVVDFFQQEPFEGRSCTEKTEVHVLFDAKYLYVGVRAFDSDPDAVNAREMTRDSDFDNDDMIEVLLDTYNDRRNAFLFAVNPLGTQQDSLVTDDGRSVNRAWDISWISEGRRDTDGFTVEIAVPLTSLRFTEGLDEWGFNVARTIRRKNEKALVSSWLRTLGISRVSQAAVLTGMTELRRRTLVDVKPYVTGQWRQNVPQLGVTGLDSGSRFTAGLEVARFGITPSLTAEVTANPDFGQAEVDTQIINFSRFSVFFPERREFFLENAGVFLFGRPGVNQLFFTRRVGLTDQGQPVPIDYGVKVTGKIGDFNVGFLQVQTRRIKDEKGAEAVPREHFTVLRVKKDVFGSSSIGAILLNRQGGQSSAYNRGVGIDAQFDPSKFWRVSAFAAGTASPGVRSGALTGRIQSDFSNNRFSMFNVYEEIGKNYNPELGFTARRDVRQYFSFASYKIRPRIQRLVREIRLTGLLEYYETRSTRSISTRERNLGVDVDFTSSANFSYNPVNESTDVLTQPFALRRNVIVPVGAYRFNRPSFDFSTNQSRRFVVSGAYQWGKFYTGDRKSFTLGMTYRPNENIQVSLENTHNVVNLPQGNFSTNLFGGRFRYNFSRKLLTTAFVQLNSAAQLTSINVRLRYIFRPNSDLFVIYNQNSGRGLQQPSYQLQFKATYYLTR